MHLRSITAEKKENGFLIKGCAVWPGLGQYGCDFEKYFAFIVPKLDGKDSVHSAIVSIRACWPNVSEEDFTKFIDDLLESLSIVTIPIL